MRAWPGKRDLNVGLVLTCAVLAWCAVGSVWAQGYPVKPIRLIAPFAAAGGFQDKVDENFLRTGCAMQALAPYLLRKWGSRHVTVSLRSAQFGIPKRIPCFRACRKAARHRCGQRTE